MNAESSVGLYIHLPFCRKKCHYCDFACYAGQEKHMEAYLAALESELQRYPKDLAARTLYLGGGTPSLVSPAQLERLMQVIRSHVRLSEDAEQTMEVNPGTGGPDLWHAAKEQGINRISLGVQTLDESLLKSLGRDHSVQDVHDTLQAIRDAGISNISLDLIYGLPGQSMEAWESTIERALELQPSHFSVYGLILEEKSIFGVRHSQGKLELPPEETEVAMGDTLNERLEAAGYGRYEISSWAIPGHEAHHNRIYWRNEPYIGLGTGAHSYWQGRRYENPRGIMDYLRNPTPTWANSEDLSLRQEQEEAAFLGLRMTREGLNKQRYQARFGEDPITTFPEAISSLLQAGLIEDQGETYILTPRGIWLSNEVFERFIA